MNVLHTSDWHLGVSADIAPRHEEHERFLTWLIHELCAREIDLLLHAGDTFHYVQPSARCLQMYYDFLAKCARDTNVRQIVITGGNHDSASRLDAPRSILEALNVHVVGAMSANPKTWEDAIIPVVGSSGHVECVVVAVPYIHESRLGVSATGRTPREIRDDLVLRFTELYAMLADQAKQLHPDVPLLGMGHLTCYPDGRGQIDGDFGTPLHMAELGSLPPTIFGLEYSYVALGHIHRMFEIPGPNAWYPGSPVPTDIIEARTPRHVLGVTVDPAKPDAQAPVTKIEVPLWRRSIELAGTLEQVTDELAKIEWVEELHPYLYVEVHVEQPLHNGVRAIEELLDTIEEQRRPRLVKYKETMVGQDGAEVRADPFDDAPLSELDPVDVFTKLYTLKHEAAPTEEILAAFHSLLGPKADA
ncbi:MAG: exonuclease SbcCD subunit D C-terminal domain-containing protein [Myxococcota bacterium]